MAPGRLCPHCPHCVNHHIALIHWNISIVLKHDLITTFVKANYDESVIRSSGNQTHPSFEPIAGAFLDQIITNHGCRGHTITRGCKWYILEWNQSCYEIVLVPGEMLVVDGE